MHGRVGRRARVVTRGRVAQASHRTRTRVAWASLTSNGSVNAQVTQMTNTLEMSFAADCHVSQFHH
jgi:hypothetical protein